MISWFDVPVEGGDGLAFASWLRHNEVAWVLWFRESWTQAPVVAPFLREGGVWTKGGLRLRETNREDEYGWILFAVEPQPGRDPLEQKP